MALEKGVLGNAIRTARMKQSLSQETLAELVDITPTHLKHIESGHRNPSIDVLINIAQILHMSIDNIIFQQDSDLDIKIKEIENGLTKCSKSELQILLDLLLSMLKNLH